MKNFAESQDEGERDRKKVPWNLTQRSCTSVRGVGDDPIIPDGIRS